MLGTNSKEIRWKIHMTVFKLKIVGEWRILEDATVVLKKLLKWYAQHTIIHEIINEDPTTVKIRHIG